MARLSHRTDVKPVYRDGERMAHSFIDDNTAYETWLHAQCDVVRKDLKHKHKRMKKNSFVFLPL